jgi:hypothetical protein
MRVALRLREEPTSFTYRSTTEPPMKKKVITKLVLRRDTVRTLINGDLAGVLAGVGANCTANTKEVSGCPSTLQLDAERLPEL